MNVAGLEYSLFSLKLQHSSVYQALNQATAHAVDGCCNMEASCGTGNTLGISYCSTSYFIGDVCRDIFTLARGQISSGEISRPEQSNLARMSAVDRNQQDRTLTMGQQVQI